MFVEKIDGGSDGEQNPTTSDTSYFLWGKEKERKEDTRERVDGEGA